MLTTHRVDQIRVELDRRIEAGIPGAFVYLDDPDGNSQFITAGWADRQTQRRMTPDSHYRIGSTTKTFTAVVVLQLIDEGVLSMSDRIADRLPGLALPNASTITVEHLLRMRSGLFDFVDDPSLLELESNLVPHTTQEAVSLAAEHPAKRQPDERFEYCNTNYCLLELIIEAASGQRLGEHLKRRIFEPLFMSHSTYPADNDLGLPEPYIRGYDFSPTEWQDCSRVFFGRGDGAIVSTAIDLSRFFRALLGGDLVAATLLEQMKAIVEDDPPGEYAYGLGLIADDLSGRTAWGHSGGGFGYRHHPFLEPQTGRFAVWMVNGSFGFRIASHPAAELARFTPTIRALAYPPRAG